MARLVFTSFETVVDHSSLQAGQLKQGLPVEEARLSALQGGFTEVHCELLASLAQRSLGGVVVLDEEVPTSSSQVLHGSFDFIARKMK